MQFDFSFSRTNHTFWGQWLWTIDLISLLITFAIMGLGTLLIMAASPGVAHTYGYDTFFFFKKHLLFVCMASALLVTFSHLSVVSIRRIAFVGLALTFFLVLLTLVVGTPIKGAKRWIALPFLHIQPSELLKPFLIIASAWLLSEQRRRAHDFQGKKIACTCVFLVVAALLLQPDIGMTFSVVAIFMIQLFLAGLSYTWLLGGAGLALLALSCAFFLFPHVKHRIEGFLYPELGNPFGDQFQIFQSVAAIKRGGFFGTGLGEGTIKANLPDAHTDFIFAVAAEEFGMFFCACLLCLYAAVVGRALFYAYGADSLFKNLAITGLASSFALQTVVNVASVLGMIPTKGMPLPFISYGGSSMLSCALTVAFLLALTRRRFYVS